MADEPLRASISTSPDEASARRRASAGGRKPRSPETDGGSGSSGGPGSGSGSGVAYLLSGLALVGLLVAGWFIFSQQRALADEAAALEAARVRILALEERLNMTDEALNETGQKSSEQITFWATEIRKLWAIVNERNLNLIKENAAAITRVEKAVGEANGTISEIRASLGRHESAFTRQEQMVDQITNLNVQLDQVQRAMRDAVDRANTAQQSVAGLNAGLAKRVTETEEAVQAIDAYRLQTNARLADLERRLGAPPL